MLKNKVHLEYQIEQRNFCFICDNDAPTSFIKEALFQFQKYVGAIEDAALAQQKAQEEANKPVEPVEEPTQE